MSVPARMSMPGAGSRPDTEEGRRSLAAGLLVFAPLAVAGNAIGSTLRYPDVGAAVLFPPYALLTAALVVSRRRHWIWYVLVGSLAHLAIHWPHWPLSWVVVADLANVTRAVLAAWLLNRLLGRPPRLDRLDSLAAFILAAVAIAPAAGATIGATNVALHGSAQPYWSVWSAWVVSNALTGFTMLPAAIPLFAWVTGARRLFVSRQRMAEALLLAAAVAATCLLLFVGGFAREHAAAPVYGALPVLIWAALRFGSGGAGAALTAITLAAIWSVDQRTGPFLAASPVENVLALQIFVVCAAVPVLCLAATATARRDVARLHQALLASLQDHVAVLDARGIVIEVNDSWRRFAQTADVAPFHRVGPGDDYLGACRSSAVTDATAASVLAGVTSVLGRERRHCEIEYDRNGPGGLEVYILSAEALERPEGGAIVTRDDVTARRRAQREIQDQRNQLSHLTRVAALGQLSGAFAHELHQPLTAILSNAEAARLILRRQPVDVAEVAAILQDIVADDRRAAAVIDRLRALLKRGDTRFQGIAIDELIGEVRELAKTELITRHVELSTVIAPDLPPVWGDRIQLQQVLLNLILNGCEAMHDGPEPPRRRLVLAAMDDQPATVHITLRDFGAGIPRDLLDHLFEPFVTTKPDGLGLGLSISRTIVAAHGGRLWGENNADGGATMHCVLPIAEPARAHARAVAATGRME